MNWHWYRVFLHLVTLINKIVQESLHALLALGLGLNISGTGDLVLFQLQNPKQRSICCGGNSSIPCNQLYVACEFQAAAYSTSRYKDQLRHYWNVDWLLK